MSYSVPAAAAQPARREKRRAPRARPDGVWVRLDRQEGSVIDISETGALFRLPMALVPNVITSMSLGWNDDSVRLHGRVVRSVPYFVQPPAGSPAETTHQTAHLVAVEFTNVSDAAMRRLQRLLDPS